MNVFEVTFILTFTILFSQTKQSSGLNNEPIIGVLTQTIPYAMRNDYSNYSSYIAASYVKFLEGGGARVVPVWLGRNDSYYRDIVNKTNGILFPGGKAWFNGTNEYGSAGFMIYNAALEVNQRGHYYPLFGICLGFQLLMYAAAGGIDYRTNCSNWNIALPLVFEPTYKMSKMFRSEPQNTIEAFQAEITTNNFNIYCYTKEILKNMGISDEWHIISTNFDKNGFQFISSIESRKYPFYGLQFHPEKSLYEWKPKAGIVHTYSAVLTTQYYARTFVNEARQNDHVFPNKTMEREALIYNYPLTYTGKHNYGYEQCYFFE